MTQEELSIVNFLRGSPESYYARREIARKAVKRQEYEQNNHWADVPLSSLHARGVIERNDNGCYRLQKEHV